jgi:hypothetical protein
MELLTQIASEQESEAWKLLPKFIVAVIRAPGISLHSLCLTGSALANYIRPLFCHAIVRVGCHLMSILISSLNKEQKCSARGEPGFYLTYANFRV